MTGPHATALAAHDAGISVVPPRQDGSKAPEGYWTKYQSKRPSVAKINEWYSDPGRTGVGFVGGEVSGGLELFEFEGRAVEAGIVERFIDLAEQRGLGDLVGLLFTGYLEKSPSDGLHILYRCAETGCVKLAKTAAGKDLIETKGEGGYMIVAPTNGSVHPTGGTWRLHRGGIDTIPTISPEQRRQLLDLAAHFDERPAPADEEEPIFHTPGGTKGGWVSQVIADYNARTTWTEVLAGRFTHLFDHGHVGYWHYEGADNHVGASTNAKGTDTLIVFSGTAQGAGWHIWEGRGKAPSYDRFSAHVLIETGRHDTNARLEIARRYRPDDTGQTRTDPAAGSTAVVPWVPVLPPEFWEARPALDHIRRAAWSRQRSADAVLHTTLTRISAIVTHQLQIPPIVGSSQPLCYFVAVIAGSGGGKSTANDIAVELVPAPGHVLDQIPPGSGEGLAELLFDMVEETGDDGKKKMVKRQVRHAAIVYIDEGQVLAELGNRKGATLLPALRTIWTGGPLGQANANRERFRVVPAGSYAFGISIGFQLEMASALLADHLAGTPQRFGWASAVDPHIEPCDWPGPLPWEPTDRHVAGQPITFADEIQTEVQADDLARSRGQTTPDPLDSHTNLYRLKIAALLAILDGRRDVTPDDWQLATIVRGTSNAVRTMVQNTVTAAEARKEHANRERAAGRAVAQDRAVTHDRVETCAVKVALKVWSTNSEWTRGDLYTAMRRHRDVFDDALDLAAHKGWIVERREVAHNGAETRLFIRGKTRPK